MNKVIKIFQIDSDEDSIETSKINEYKVIDFGNGFLISNDGYLASVAHVLPDNDLNSFALCDGKLQKIEVIERILTERNENHIDAAIGKLDLCQTDYFNPLYFERVTEGTELKIIGYSRILNRNEYSDKNDNPLLNCFLNNLQALCLDLKYAYSNDLIKMHNSFTIIINQTDLGGISGCPIINESNNVVGVFKGGSKIGNKLKGQAIHIDVITKIFNKYCSNY